MQKINKPGSRLSSLFAKQMKNSLKANNLESSLPGRRLIVAVAALLVVCGASLSGSALAEHGSGSGSHDSTESGTEVKTVSTSGSGEVETETEPATEQEVHKSETLREQFKQTAKAQVQTKAEDKSKTHTAEQRQKACTARKANLTNRMNNAVAAAQRHKDNFDKIYAKVKTFHDSKNLNTPNYDALVAAADAAGSDSVSKIAALKALDITVDCTQTDSLATNISAFQTAVKSTRDSLKDYRKAIVSLITALHDGNKTTDDSSTNSTTN
jgi:hypothetical protein